MLDFAQLERGQLIVGVLPGQGGMWLPPFLAAFIKHYPHVSVRLVERWSAQLFALLDSGDIHVAVVLLPASGYEPPPGMMVRTCFEGELAVVVAPHHRLAHGTNVTLEELAREPLVLTSPDETPRAIVEQAFHARGLDPAVVFEANDPTTLVRLAGEGIGAGITGLAIGRAHADVVRTVPLEGGSLRYVSAVVWPEGGPHTKALARFVDFLLAWWREAGLALVREITEGATLAVR
jgi:DNA-binding transcriptional LysR family regulator